MGDPKGKDPKVNCPFEDENPQEIRKEDIPVSDEKCIGSLVLTHSNTGSLGEYRRIHLSENDQYVNIRKKFSVLKKHVIHAIKAKGSCCWELFPLPKYRGKKRQV